MNDRLEIASRMKQAILSDSEFWKTYTLGNNLDEMALSHADALIALEAETRKDDLKIVGNAAEWHYNEGIIKGHAQAIGQVIDVTDEFKEYFGDRAFNILQKKLSALKPEVKE